MDRGLAVNAIKVAVVRDLDPSVFLCGVSFFRKVERSKGAFRQITTVPLA